MSKQTSRLPVIAGPSGSTGFCNGTCCMGVCQTYQDDSDVTHSVCCAISTTCLPSLNGEPAMSLLIIGNPAVMAASSR